MTEEMKKQVHDLRNVYTVGLTNLAAWNQYAPNMQQTEEALRLVEDSLNKSPSLISGITDEKLLDHLEKANQEAQMIGSIPKPTQVMSAVSSTAGSAVFGEFNEFVTRIGVTFSYNPEVVGWAGETIKNGNALREKQKRSEIVRRRVSKLKPLLGELHIKATRAALAAQANTQTPIEAAATLNRLLEQFKGALINKCRSGKGTNYARISDNLAANSALTKTVVADGQDTYDTLNIKLVEIRKSMQPATGDEIIALLHQVEDHIIMITDAIDSEKLGISFF